MQLPGADEADLPGGDIEARRHHLEAAHNQKDDDVISNGSVTSSIPASPPLTADKTKSSPTKSEPTRVSVEAPLSDLKRQPSRSSLASIKSRIMVRM